MKRPTVRKQVMGGVNLVLLLLLYFALPVRTDTSVGRMVLSVFLAFAALVGIALFVAMETRRSEVTGRFRLGPANLLLLLEIVLIAFAFIYFAIDTHDDAQIAGIETRVDALYFTVSTTATVGFGDIHAVEQVARALVTLQMAFNVGFIAIFANLFRRRLHAYGREDGDEERRDG